ncbi:MAG: hypothetical protein JRF34_11545 [Deltaproteobacteria bacterium]|nr:hypothetical protein [Deltaproteobacteria bacterium]
MTFQIRFSCIKTLFPFFTLLLFAGCATDGTNVEPKQLQVTQPVVINGTNVEPKQLQVTQPVVITEQDNALSHDGPVENCTEVLASTPKKPFQ